MLKLPMLKDYIFPKMYASLECSCWICAFSTSFQLEDITMNDLEEDKIRYVLRDAVTTLCRNSILFNHQLNVQGLLAVTVDSDSVVILQVYALFINWT